MSDSSVQNTLQDDQQNTDKTEELIHQFAKTNSPYYVNVFAKLSEAPGFRASFNLFAALFSPIWFGARGLWSWFLVFLLVESAGYIQLARGLFGNLGQDQLERAEAIRRTLNSRLEQIEEARATGSSSLASLERATQSLQGALDDALAQAQAASGDSLGLIILGLFILIASKVIVALSANWTLETRFTKWRSDNSLAHGLSMPRTLIATVIFGTVAGLTALRFARPDLVPSLLDFPTDKMIRIGIADSIKGWFDWAKQSGGEFFNTITLSVRSLLDALEVVFVGTPWPVTILVVAILAWLSGGARVAIFTTAALAYLGILGFWEKAMTTISLLGAAAMVSITLGIPIGIACARHPRLYLIVRPILDFMQSMPSFVYLIPVIAFFGAGKPAAIVATLIFGSPPVIRLTVLGLQQVPHAAREAALAFGATPSYLLFKVDLPLASKTIMAGVNQTILLSLAMVVVASLIGAKGLGEDVLEALQFASEGQGILAGLAILFCALILDRIVAGKAKT